MNRTTDVGSPGVLAEDPAKRNYKIKTQTDPCPLIYPRVHDSSPPHFPAGIASSVQTRMYPIVLFFFLSLPFDIYLECFPRFLLYLKGRTLEMDSKLHTTEVF